MRILRGMGWLVLVLAAAALLGGWALHTPRPEGRPGPRAEALAGRILDAVDADAWAATGAVRWTFVNHRHLWDRQRHLARVRWGDCEVLVDLHRRRGVAFEDGRRVGGQRGEDLVRQAWAHWVNDAFWLNPFPKLHDPGVRREWLRTDAGPALLVTFTQGGATPGDAYLIEIDDAGRPVAWRMWVSILPVGGLRVTWQDWVQLPTGAHVARAHRLGPLPVLRLSEVAAAATLAELSPGPDPFAPLVADAGAGR